MGTKKKVIITVAVEVEYDDRTFAYLDLGKNVTERITAFLYPVGMEITKAEVASVEHNS